MKTIIITISIFLFSISSNSQNSPKEIIHQFFEEFENHGSRVALDNLYKPNKWMNRNADVIEKLKTKVGGLNEEFVGKYYGYEFIVEKRLTDSYVLMCYLVKYERQPIRFTFEFYKPNQNWVIQGFKFDGNMDDEIEEAAKLYNFRLN